MGYDDLQPSSAQNSIVEDEKWPKDHCGFHLSWVQISNDEKHHSALLTNDGEYLTLSRREKCCSHLRLYQDVQSLGPGDPLRTRRNEKYACCLVHRLSLSVRYPINSEKCTVLTMRKWEIYPVQQGASQYIDRDTRRTGRFLRDNGPRGTTPRRVLQPEDEKETIEYHGMSRFLKHPKMFQSRWREGVEYLTGGGCLSDERL